MHRRKSSGADEGISDLQRRILTPRGPPNRNQRLGFPGRRLPTPPRRHGLAQINFKARKYPVPSGPPRLKISPASTIAGEFHLRREPPNPRQGAAQRRVLFRRRGSDPGRLGPPPVHPRRRLLPQPAVQDREPGRERAVDLEKTRRKLRRVFARAGVELPVLQRIELLGDRRRYWELSVGDRDSATEDELPERLIGAVRVSQIELAAARMVGSDGGIEESDL